MQSWLSPENVGSRLMIALDLNMLFLQRKQKRSSWFSPQLLFVLTEDEEQAHASQTKDYLPHFRWAQSWFFFWFLFF